MDQLLTFIGNHPILVGAFAVVLAALIATESARLTRRWKELDTNQAIMLINRKDPLIIDVSNSADYAKGHILNAENLPPSRIEAGNQKLQKSMDRPVLIYCKNGQVSPQMATRLARMGFQDVNLLSGGLAQWSSDQQPVTRGKDARKPRTQARPERGARKKSKGRDKGGKRRDAKSADQAAERADPAESSGPADRQSSD